MKLKRSRFRAWVSDGSNGWEGVEAPCYEVAEPYKGITLVIHRPFKRRDPEPSRQLTKGWMCSEKSTGSSIDSRRTAVTREEALAIAVKALEGKSEDWLIQLVQSTVIRRIKERMMR